MVKGTGGARERVVGGAATAGAGRPVLRAIAGDVGATGRSLGESWAPWLTGDAGPMAGSAAVFDPRAAREEILHAMTQRAAHEGTTSQLPMLARPAAHAYRAANATGSRNLTGLAQVLDELSAQTMAARGPAGKLGALSRYLFDPATQAAYGAHFGQFGMLPRAVYHGVPAALQLGPEAGALAYGATRPVE